MFLSSLTGLHNEFSAQLHKFMAHLTDAQHKTVGHTVLYVPDEGPAMASPEAHKDKELVHRLEGEVTMPTHTHTHTHTHARTHTHSHVSIQIQMKSAVF